MLSKRVKVIGTWIISSMAVFSTVVAFFPSIRSSASYIHHFFEAVDYVIENRANIDHIIMDDQTLHEMYSRVYKMEGSIDSTRLKIKILSHSKYPFDSLWLQTNSGWKKFHRSTPWIWNRDPDR